MCNEKDASDFQRKLPPRRVAFDLDENDLVAFQTAVRMQMTAFACCDLRSRSCIVGAMIGEICREWMEYHEKWEPTAKADPA